MERFRQFARRDQKEEEWSVFEENRETVRRWGDENQKLECCDEAYIQNLKLHPLIWAQIRRESVRKLESFLIGQIHD